MFKQKLKMHLFRTMLVTNTTQCHYGILMTLAPSADAKTHLLISVYSKAHKIQRKALHKRR